MNKTSQLKALLILCVLSVILPACSTLSGQETVGEYVDDATITSRVKLAILQDPLLKSLQISVETFQNTVQLRGFVDTPAEAARAQQLAASIPGVRMVKNDIIVRSLSGSNRKMGKI